MVSPSLSYTPTHPPFQEIEQQLVLLLDKCPIEEIPHPAPGFYSRVFLALKKSGDWRPVIDLSTLSKHLRSPHFGMEMTTSIMHSLQQGHWATFLGFKDAFFHIPITGPHQRYLSFQFGHRHFQFQALPFSLATSSYLFTGLVKAVGTFARAQGLYLLQYLGDWNISASTAPARAVWTTWLLNLSQQLGLVINLAKCNLVPFRCFVLWASISTSPVGQPDQLLTELVQNLLHSLQIFAVTRNPPAGRWQQLLSHMKSLEKLTQWGRLDMCPLQFVLHNNWDHSSDHPFPPIITPPDVHTVLQ